MNIASITSHVKWLEGYILWHMKLFHYHVHGDIPGYITLKSSYPPSPPSPPQIHLSADLQQIVFLLHVRQAKRLNTFRVSRWSVAVPWSL